MVLSYCIFELRLLPRGYYGNINDLVPQQTKQERSCVLCRLLNIYCSELTGGVLVILMEWLTHQQRLTGLLSG